MRLVDVAKGARLEAVGKAIVFFFGDVAMRLVEQFGCAMQTAAPVEVRVDGRMIVNILSVFDGGAFDFVDGLIDFANGDSLLFTQFATIGTLQMSASVTKVGQGVKVRGMLPRRLRRCGEKRRDEQQKRGDNEHQFASGFHLACDSYSNEMNLQDPSSRNSMARPDASVPAASLRPAAVFVSPYRAPRGRTTVARTK